MTFGERLREAEINESHVHELIEEDVLDLDVPMHKIPMMVEEVDRADELAENAEEFAHRRFPAVEMRKESPIGTILVQQEIGIGRLVNPEAAADEWVVEATKHAQLKIKLALAQDIAKSRLMDLFHGNGKLGSRVAGVVNSRDRTTTANAERGERGKSFADFLHL